MISDVFIGDIAIANPFPERSQISDSTYLETLSMRGHVRRCVFRLAQTQALWFAHTCVNESLL
jgi:hypothetical protein